MRFLWPVITVLLGASFCTSLQAQERCAIVEYTQNLQKNKGLSETTPQFEEWIKKNISQRKAKGLRQQETTYRIPVVVHVIHNGQSVGSGSNISDERITSQIDVLNEDFNRLNADAVNTPDEFQSVAGKISIEFVLAKQDPEGNPTDGIVRVDGEQSSWSVTSDDEELKALSYWDSNYYLNIWVTNLSGSYLGYAQFPVSDLDGLEAYTREVAETDGVVIDYTVFGLGAPSSSYNLGRTTTHEVGHYLGLRHIWGDDSGCSSSNDYVEDTPNQSEETYNCPVHPQVDCSSTDKMFQNYMDYTDDACMNLFTEGQVDRMITVLDESPRRNTLSTSYGLEEPVIGEIDVAVTKIEKPVSIVCDSEPELRFTVSNLSDELVSELIYTITVNELVTTYTVDFSTPFTGSVEVSAGNVDLNQGENSLKVEITRVNGATDPETSNNTLESTVTVLYPDCDPFAIYTTAQGSSVITFDLDEASPVEVSIINFVGQEIAHARYDSLINQTITLSNADVIKGAFIIRLRIGQKYYSRKVIL